MSLSSELKAIRPGDHLCLIYDDDEERLKILILYILEGLRKREKVFVLNENEEEIKEILKELADLENVSNKHLIFLNPERFYLRRGFNSDILLEELCEIEDKAYIDGFKGIRVARNTGLLSFNDERILKYEAKVNSLLEKTTMLCLYDARRFDSNFLKKVVRLHPKIIWKGKVLDNFKFDVEGEEDYFLLMKKISEMGELKKEFQRLKEQSRILFEGSDGIFILRGDTFVSCNSKALELLGVNKHELIGKKPWDFSPIRQPDGKNSRKKALKKINSALSGKPQVFEWQILRDGEVVDLEISLSRFMIDDKYHLMMIARDITERKKMEEKLKESEKKYRQLWENAGDILFIIDLEGNFLEANRTARELFGYSEEELRKLNIRDVVDERYLPAIYQEMEKIINSKRSEILNLEILCYTKDGKAIWIESRAKPIVEGGKVKAIQGIARDVTERKRKSKLLRAVNEINKHLIREKDEFDLIKSASKELNSLEYFLSWIGIKKDDVLVTTSSILGNIRLNGKNINCVSEALVGQNTVVREGLNSKCEKCEFYDRHKGLVRYAIPMIANEKVRGAFVIYSENTIADDEFEILQTLANDLAFAINTIELEKAKLKAFEQIERNIENYAILVDQIRNPLAIISGTTEMRLDGNEELKDLKEIIIDAVRRIEDIVSKLDKGWLESERIRNFLKGKSRN